MHAAKLNILEKKTSILKPTFTFFEKQCDQNITLDVHFHK